MKRFKVTFVDGRIGRTRDVAPQEFKARDEGYALAEQIDRFARKYLMSNGVEVVTFSNGEGSIAAGFHIVGRFTWEEVTS